MTGREMPLERGTDARGSVGRLRWTHVALTVGAALLIAVVNWRVPLDHPGPLLLVPLAYVSAVAGARGAIVASLPLLGYYAYFTSRPHEPFRYDAEGLRRLILFMLSTVMIALIVGRSGTRRRRKAASSAESDMSRQLAESGARLAELEKLNKAELAELARALARTNEELDQFAYITSHDLRAPLRGIANLSQWIEEDMGDHLTPEAHQQMELLRGRVHRMEAMIDGILEYSRIGRVKVETEQIDVGALLADVIDLLDPPAGFEVVVEPGMPIVSGHKLRLQQVFMNLLGNAIKHHDKPAGRIVVSCRRLDGFYEFAVADDGPGIDPKYHDKVFVIFQTLQPRDKVEGTGLGLSLVRKIVEAEGGRITVESQPGAGTTFHFTWPRG